MVHSLTMANMSGEFHEEAHNGLLLRIFFIFNFPRESCHHKFTFHEWKFTFRTKIYYPQKRDLFYDEMYFRDSE